jgi:hypothetical protein
MMAGLWIESEKFEHQLTFIIEQTTKPQEASSPPTSLPGLLPELQLQIFSYLDPCFSTCLGLTCKRFYGIHRHLHGTVSAMEFDYVGPNKWFWLRLCDYLDEWSSPDWTWSWAKGKFIRSEESEATGVMRGLRVRRQLFLDCRLAECGRGDWMRPWLWTESCSQSTSTIVNITDFFPICFVNSKFVIKKWMLI